MTDILLQWIAQHRSDIEQYGFTLEWKSGYLSESSGVKVDSTNTVGNITFWPPNRFEFHFLSGKDGRELLLKEYEASSVDELHDLFLSIQPKLAG